ncbi:MAG: hypothetical protein C0475_05100 [Planctomyces sp.]|nr:hypothetical protein [Planctomyces sp.]MBA4119788.1 hypothetical protein [Isosphaera sp.]
MSTTELALWVGLIAAGSVASFLCSGSEMGAYSINRARLRLRAESGRHPSASRLERELSSPGSLLASLLIGNTLANYAIASGVSGLLTGSGLSQVTVLVVTVLAVAPTLFVCCETLPKELFRARADAWLPRVSLWLSLLRRGMRGSGVLWAVGRASRAAEWLLPARWRAEGAGVQTARQRMAELLKEGARHGSISEHQATLVDRALSLRDTTVGQEMVPWSRVRTLGIDWPADRVLEALERWPLSRLPVIDRAGRLAGIADHLDVCLARGRLGPSLLRPAVEVHPGASVIEALQTMLARGERIAVAVARGRPVGIVTTKDLIEPLTGEFQAW